jgi:hypothetical protein
MKKTLFKSISLGVFILIAVSFFALRNLKDEKIVDESKSVFIKKNDNGF